MAQSVSNDALWEKLSEIEGKVVEAIRAKKALDPEQNRQVEITAASKEEIIETIKEEICKYGQSYESYFEANEKNIKTVYNSVLKIQQQTEQVNQVQIPEVDEPKKSQDKDKQAYFYFIFFRVRKTSVIIAILGLLVFILTLFCMKQQNDYSLLNSKYYRQYMVIDRILMEIDSLKNMIEKPKMEKKRR